MAPEKYSLKQQISFIKGADEIACTEGTLSHLILFAKPTCKLTILRRDYYNYLYPQLIINDVTKIDVCYVDATFNLLPIKHSGGVFLYGPTIEFIKYMKYKKLKYSEKDIKFNIKDYAGDYIQLWLKKYKPKRNFQSIEELEMIDVYECLDYAYEEFKKYQKQMKSIQKNKKRIKKIKKVVKKIDITPNKVLFKFCKKVYKRIKKH